MKNKRGKITHLLLKAKQELSLFKKYRKFSNLSQACEKTWVAFLLAVEYKSGDEIKKHYKASELASKLGYSELFHRTKYLHIIHYEGSPDLRYEEIIPEIEYLIHRIRGMV